MLRVSPLALLLAPVALLACERAADHVPPAPSLAPAGVATLENGRPARVATPAPTPKTTPIVDQADTTAITPPAVPGPLAPPAVLVARGRMPVPPSVEIAAYHAWKRTLPADQLAQVMAFCRRHPFDFRRTCGGIGPLHIPMPPRPRLKRPEPIAGGAPAPRQPPSLFATMDDWRAALTRSQRAYVKRTCDDQGEGMPDSDLCGDNTPLVVSFDGAPVTFLTGGSFAFQPGAPISTDWPTAATPWIALDLDGDGAITSGAELFGSDTRLASGARAPHGFVALAQHDANGDGVIDRSDPIFAALLLWSDANGDQRSSSDELAPLGHRVYSIALDYAETAACDARANCEGQRAAVTWRDADGGERTGAVIDVYLPRRHVSGPEVR